MNWFIYKNKVFLGRNVVKYKLKVSFMNIKVKCTDILCIEIRDW